MSWTLSGKSGVRALMASAFVALSVSANDVQNGNFGAETSALPAKTTAKSTTHEKRNSYPFSGEIESRDSKSLTLKGKKKARVLILTPETRVLKNGVSARVANASSGQRVSGSARKNASGQEVAVTINLK
jgi:hypothetical protein